MHGESFDPTETTGPVILLKTILGAPKKQDKPSSKDSKQEKAAE